MSNVGSAVVGRPGRRDRGGRPRERAPVHAPDAARGEHPDPGRERGDHRGRDGGRGPAAASQGDPEARPRGLEHRAGRRRRERLERRRIEAHEQSTIPDRDRRRHRAGRGSDRGLGRRRDLEVLRVRQAVADERRFERDDRAALGQCRQPPPARRSADLRRSGNGHHWERTCRKRSAGATLSPMPAPRPMTPADLRRVVVVEELDLSVDGRTAVVVKRSIAGNRYVSHLYAIDLGSRRRVPRPVQLTHGRTRDTKPRLCPDGRTLAFVRTDPADDDAPAAIAGLDLNDPGEVRMARVGRHGGVGEIAWSPDGRRLAFTAEVDPPRFIVGPVPPVSRRPRRRNERPGRRRPLAARSPHHPGRLALGRPGTSRPLVAPVRHRSPGREAAPGDERRFRRRGHRVAPGRSDRGVHRRPRPRARPASPHDDLGRRRGRARRPGRHSRPSPARSSPRRAGPTTPRGPPTAAGSRRSACSSPSRSTT